MIIKRLVLGWPPKELNPNARVHWAKKHKAFQKYKLDCFYLAKPFAACFDITITFHPPTRHTYDRDNCIARFKAGQDGIALAWGIDDSEIDVTYKRMGEPIKNGRVVLDLDYTIYEG